MNEQNKNIQTLITPEDIPGGVASRQGIHAVPELIEMPVELQPKTSKKMMGAIALEKSTNGRYGLKPMK